VTDLDERLLAAHAAGDLPALAMLYSQAADAREASGDIDAACFYLTHAFVFALEADDAQGPVLHARLKSYGREE
jgi:hypothetical protein